MGKQFIKSRCFIGLFLFIITLNLFPVTIAALTADEILKDIFKRQGLGHGSYVLDFNLQSFDGKKTNEAKIRIYYYDTTKQIVTFIAPDRLKDNSYLVIRYNTWMYQKGLKRPVRIAAQQKLFGEAGIAETVGIDYMQDYKIINVTEDSNQYEFELKALDQRTAYQKAKLLITKDGLFLKKVTLLTLSGAPIKELMYETYRQVNDHEVATVEIRNLMQETNRKTTIEFINIDSRELPVSAFDPLMLDKLDLLFK